jgi:hypothetical protein
MAARMHGRQKLLAICRTAQERVFPDGLTGPSHSGMTRGRADNGTEDGQRRWQTTDGRRGRSLCLMSTPLGRSPAVAATRATLHDVFPTMTSKPKTKFRTQNALKWRHFEMATTLSVFNLINES